MRNAVTTIREHLLRAPELTALVGTRVYAGVTPPPHYNPADGPCIVFGTRGGADAYHSATLMPSIQYSCYGADIDTAWDVDRALYDALVDQPGLGVRQSRLEVYGQLLTQPETGWYYVWSAYRHWLVNN